MKNEYLCELKINKKFYRALASRKNDINKLFINKSNL